MTASRHSKTHVKTARRRSHASTLWLERQLNDPLVHEARRLGYRARSVFKLQEIDRRYQLLRPGAAVLDLGAAPGSWSQYAAERGCRVVALDLVPVDPIVGVTILQVQARVEQALGGPVDLVLSDIASPSTGQRSVDRLRAEAVAEAVVVFAAEVLRPGGHCLLKLLKGVERNLLPQVHERFTGYRLIKPTATRKESSELFLLATGRRGVLATGRRGVEEEGSL
jgi:23S rRNA (uridine2552-2'-O)-methyltransferase